MVVAVAVDIWVEGEGDQKFISDLLSEWFNISFKPGFRGNDQSHNITIQIRKGKGVSSFNSAKGWQEAKSDFEQNDTTGVKNLIIIDADEDFEKRKNEVKKTIDNVNFNPENDLFLIPNHHDKGNLETLLEQIINRDHSVLFKCWDDYQTCLRSSPLYLYTTPSQKAKIYAYLEALLPGNMKQMIKPELRDYTKQDHWNLDHTKEPLKPLYEFLKKHLTP